MRSITLRRPLPIIQLVLAAALILVGNAQQTAELAECKAGPTWCLPNHDLPLPSEIALGVNAPAVLGALPIILLCWAFVGEKEWPVYLAGGIAILAFWYFIGLLVDRKRGLLPAPIKKPARLPTRVFAWIGLLLCPVLAVLSFKQIFEIQGWHGEHDVYTYAGYSVWLMVAAVVLALKLRRWQALARAADSSPQP